MGFAAPPLVYVGVAMVASVAVAGLWTMVGIHSFLTRFPHASRGVSPRPLTVGMPGKVTVSIEATRGGRSGAAVRRALASSLDIREQAAAELTGGLGTKATVSRTSQALTLSYTLQPSRRGRWPLGPALVHSSDPLGMMWSDTPVGRPEIIPVWPSIVDLSGTAGALMGHADRVVLGARTPSADDAALRDYRDGDDLRRVHWPSTARTGTMLVRSDERAGRRPATVIVDLPRSPAALEWAITAAASIAVSVLESGHPVRLLGGDIEPAVTGHIAHEHPEAARAELLNLTVDLHSASSGDASLAQLLRATEHAHHDLVQGEVIVGVFEPLSQEAVEALTTLGQSGRAWALVRAERSDKEAAQQSALALRRVGWRASVASVSDPLEQAWTTVLTDGDVQ